MEIARNSNHPSDDYSGVEDYSGVGAYLSN